MNRLSSVARLPAALLVLAALLAGCSSGPNVLARVGDRTITTDDFLDVARRNQQQYAGPPEIVKSALLEDLVKRELLVLEAQKRGLVPADDLARVRREAEEQEAFRTLVERVAPRDVPVSEAEVQAFHRQRANEAHTLVVFTADHLSIEQALAEIRRGANFGTVADRFNSTGMTPSHGDLGFVAAGQMVQPIDQVIATGVVGQVVGPLESPGDGWFLVKVTEHRPRQQEPLERERDMLRSMLQQRKQRVLLQRVQRELLAEYRVRLEPGGAQALFARYNAPKDTVLVGGSRLPVPAVPTDQEARQVLARFDGEGGKPALYTLGDAVGDLQDPGKVRPNLAMTPLIEQWLRSMTLQRVSLIEIRRRHLQEEPAIARLVRERVKNMLLQAAYNTLVVTATTASEEDTRAAFRRHAAQLVGKDGLPVTYEKLEPAMKQALQAEALEVKRDQRLTELTESLRRKYTPEIHRERLARVPWPPPPGT